MKYAKRRCPDCGYLIELPEWEPCRVCVARKMRLGISLVGRDTNINVVIENELTGENLAALERLKQKQRRRGQRL